MFNTQSNKLDNSSIISTEMKSQKFLESKYDYDAESQQYKLSDLNSKSSESARFGLSS